MADDRVFRVGVTPDVINSQGDLDWGGVTLNHLKQTPGIEVDYIRGNTQVLFPKQVKEFDAIFSFGCGYDRATFSDPEMRLVLIARFGVGYDNVDVQAATEAGVIITISPDGVRRPMATAILTFILALSHKLLIKDRLIRAGRWDERTDHMGVGLTGRAIGLIGVGNIGRDFCEIVRPLNMKLMGHDPYIDQPDVEPLGVRLVNLDTLLRESDFVCVNCPLTKETEGLIGERELALMKPTAFLINTARGPIVDERALHSSLASHQIAGAGLDVFESEPTPPDNPILQLDNVIVIPHSICWTDECYSKMETSATQAILDVARGATPQYVVNKEALKHPRLRDRLDQLAAENAQS